MEISKEEWNAHMCAQEHAEFLQSYEWGEFQYALKRDVIRNHDPRFFFSAIQMKLPLGLSYMYIPRGPVLREEHVAGFIEAAKNEAHERRVAFVRFEPLFLETGGREEKVLQKLQTIAGKGRIRKTLSIQPKTVWVVDMSKSVEELFAGMHPKTRYNIRLAERKGVSVSCAQTKEKMAAACETFLRLAHQTSRRQEFHLHSETYYRTMAHILGEIGMLNIYTAEYKGRAIAAAIILCFGDTATYVHGGSDDTYREMMAPQMLHWRAMQDMRARGVRWYDMGGIDGSGDTRHPWAGITRFKQGFGGFLRQYAGTYDLIFRMQTYTLYEWLRRIRRASVV